MYWARLTFAFFGFCQVSEFTSPTPTTPNTLLILSALSVTSTQLKVQLRHSKTKQFGQPQTIIMAAIGTSICPVRAMTRYLPARQAFPPGPLFVLASGRYIPNQKGCITHHPKNALQCRRGPQPLQYTQLPHRRGHNGGSPGPPDQTPRSVVQQRISAVYPATAERCNQGHG